MNKLIKLFRQNFQTLLKIISKKNRTIKLNSFIPLSLISGIQEDSFLQFKVGDGLLLALGIISLIVLLLFKRFFVNKTTNTNQKILKHF